jgi:hypothetical protein
MGTFSPGTVPAAEQFDFQTLRRELSLDTV